MDIVARPWYREFWVWFFLAILGMGVASGTGVLVIGIKNAPQMVTGDYEKLGKALIDTHRRSDRARQLGLAGRLELTGETAVLALTATEADQLPDQLLLHFEHPTDATRDVAAVARRLDDGRWQARLDTVRAPDRARVILSDLEQTWWLAGRFEGAPDGSIGLAPVRL